MERCGWNHRTLCEGIKDCKGCKNNRLEEKKDTKLPFQYEAELTSLRQQLTAAKLRLTKVSRYEIEIGDANRKASEEFLRAEKAEADLVSFLQTLEVRAEDNRFLRQENKRLRADMRQAHAWAVLCGTPTGINLARFLEQALKGVEK